MKFFPASVSGLSASIRWLLISRMITAIAGAAVPILATVTVVRSGGASHELSLILTAGALPALVALMFSGHLVAVLPPGRLILVGDLVNAFSCLGVAATAHANVLPMASLALCSAASASCSAILYPAYGTLIKQSAAPEQLQTVNALRSMVGSAAAIGGPALAGLLSVRLAPASCWLWASGAFVIGGILVGFVPGRAAGQVRGDSLVDSLKSGWIYFKSQPWLVSMTVFSAVWHTVVWAPLLVLGPIILATRFGSPSSWGWFQALVGVGGLVMAVPFGAACWRRVLVPAVAGLSAVSLTAALFATGAPETLLVGSGLVVGAGLCAAEIFWHLGMQSWIPDEQLGNMFSYDYLVSVSLFPLGLALTPLVNSLIGSNVTLVAGAIVSCVAASTALLWRNSWQRSTVAAGAMEITPVPILGGP